MATIRYVNDLGNGHSGYLTYDAIQVTTASGATVTTQQNGPVGSDAFGRLRISNPVTLFDSSHRYSENGHWSVSSGVGGATTFNANQGLVELAVTTSSGSKIYKETDRVFPYQPGKSLLVMATFVMAPGQTNLRQRVGYFGSGNGIYYQMSGNTAAFVKRTSISGSVTETVVTQSNWNEDKLDGTGPSSVSLDATKAQIFWTDIEWLGVGRVRTGFVINGTFIHCHSFDHANLIDTTYMTTASLPVRYEIEALNTLTSAATLKEICSTVISEGGYELRGDAYSISTPLSTPRTFTASGTFYPIASIRLKTSPNRLDGVVIPNAIAILGQGNNGVFHWKVVKGATTSGGTWTSAGSSSCVEYNLSGTSYSGGTDLAAGFITASNQVSTALELPTEQLFRYQLERNSFTSTPYELTFVAASKAAADTAYASLNWEEVTQ